MIDLSHGLAGGVLEVRKASGVKRLTGRFPYNKRAVISDGGRNGRPQKETFAPRAFAHRVEDPEAEIHLLSGHRYDKPLASKRAGTLKLRDTALELFFEALITPEIESTSFWGDVAALLIAGLATGLSPGFRLPPVRAVPAEEAEEFIDEELNPDEGMHGARIRVIKQALLFELSIVTAPAYPDAQVSTRAASPGRIVRPTQAEVMRRWRA